MARSRSKSNKGSSISSGSDFNPSGVWPCSTSNKARSAFVQSTGCEERLSRISSNTDLNPRPTIYKKNIDSNIYIKALFNICIYLFNNYKNNSDN